MKKFLIHIHRGSTVLEPILINYRRGFDMYGYKFVIHRSHLGYERGWVISEYEYGLGCNVMGTLPTIRAVVLVAKNNLRRFGKKKFIRTFEKHIKKWKMIVLNQ